jgi:L-Ala-D/L-Glu epimerase
VKFSARAMTVHLKEPFAGARGVITEVGQTVVRLDWEGLTGGGAALAAPEEFAGCGPLLAGADPFALRSLPALLAGAGLRPAAASAVDTAAHDLLGKAAGLPLHHLLGLAGRPLPPTALSIGACGDDELRRRGRELADWPVLKLKMTAADDGGRAGVLRSVYGGRIWVDGNGSWSAERALQVAAELARHGVEVLEQPVAAGRLEELAHVHAHSPVPVWADEDCQGPQDVLALRGRVTGVNVKLIKCGGPGPALETAVLARSCGLKVMLGCKTESSLGVTAMAHLAGLADLLDLDGHLGLRDDPFTGLRADRGVLTLPDGPGLGVQPPPQDAP